MTAPKFDTQALIKNMAAEVIDYLGDTGVIEFSDEGKVQILLEAAAQINPTIRCSNYLKDEVGAAYWQAKGD